ncbi:MAG: hypothetical protein AABY22_35320 [Nanoarchaeota archaeon]
MSEPKHISKIIPRVLKEIEEEYIKATQTKPKDPEEAREFI